MKQNNRHIFLKQKKKNIKSPHNALQWIICTARRYQHMQLLCSTQWHRSGFITQLFYYLSPLRPPQSFSTQRAEVYRSVTSVQQSLRAEMKAFNRYIYSTCAQESRLVEDKVKAGSRRTCVCTATT